MAKRIESTMGDLYGIRDVPFDYEDFITNKLVEIHYNLVLLEDFWFMNSPDYNKNLIRECNIALLQLKAMSKIPKEELDKARITRRND